MARRDRTNDKNDSNTPAEAPAEATTEVQEDNVSTATPEATDASTETKDKPAEVDLTGFKSAVKAAVSDTEKRDATTGELVPELIEPVNAEFRKLDGIKAKNKAKGHLNDEMKSAMNALDMPLARSYMILSEKLSAAGSTPGTPGRPPADPTEAFVQRVVGLQLATALAKGTVPEGVNEDWTTKANELYAESEGKAQELIAWLAADEETRGDEPETSAVVKAAVKLAQGKAAKVGGSRPSSAGAGDGVRRDIGKHILSAFEGKESGTFLTVAEIRKHRSEEYGDNPPSAGAISARLFPDSGNCTVAGITPGTNDKSNKGATKD